MTTASVIIPSRGGADRLPRLLACLAAQSDPDWEAVVVVDGDIDNSAAVLDRYSHLPLHVIVFPENRGRVAALNAGLAAATGEVLIRCDDDLAPGVDYVRQHRAAHAGAPVGAVGLYRNVMPDTPYARVYGRHADSLYRRDAYSTPEDRRWMYWAGNASITRETYEQVGGYDPRYRKYGFEDVDYGYRLQRAGIPVKLVPELETPHHVAATTTAIRTARAFHSGAARRTFDALHGVEVLGPMELGNGAWNRTVGRVAQHVGPTSLRRLSGVADAAARVLPGPVARKLVALLVEAGSHAGYREPSGASNEI